MVSIVVRQPKALEVRSANVPEPEADEVVVKVRRAGICGSDVHILHGSNPFAVISPGHRARVRSIVADIDEARLERAKSFGADAVIDSQRQSVPEAVKGETDGLGPTLVVDAAGVPAVLDEACRVASPAGRIGILGFSPAPSALSQQEVDRNELTIIGSRLNRRLLPQAVSWLTEGRLKPESMIAQVFAAADAQQAFDLIEQDPQRTLKVQLDFS